MNKITKLLADILVLPTAQINDALTMQSTDSWDSLKHMELIASIEQEFGIELTVDDIVLMGSFQGIIKILSQKGVAL